MPPSRAAHRPEQMSSATWVQPASARCARAPRRAGRGRRHRTARRRRGAARPRADRTDPLPDPARARWAGARLPAGHARARPRPGARALRGAAAAPVRRSVLHLAPRPARERAADRPARNRPRRRHHARGRGGCARARRGPDVEERLRAGRNRLADRSDRRNGHRAAAGRAPAARDHRRGREPGQRRHGARALPARPGTSRSCRPS